MIYVTITDGHVTIFQIRLQTLIVFDGQNINYQDYEISEDCKMKKINLSL
jgi:hypothetical protein